jgi:predicted RNA-binding protein YlqC (UPF0109 family)
MSSQKVNAIDLVEEEGSATPIGRIAQMLIWIAPNPEKVNLHIAEGYRKILVEIDVPKEDMGRLIGRNGHTINALRTIFYTSLSEEDPDFDVSIPDEKRDRRRRTPRGRRTERGSEDSE